MDENEFRRLGHELIDWIRDLLGVPDCFSGVLIDALPDASLPNQSLGRNGNGNAFR